MEDFRIRVQRVLSDKRVIALSMVLAFIVFMVVLNFGGTTVADFWTHLTRGMHDGKLQNKAFTYPNPLSFNWARMKWYYLICIAFSAACSARLGYLMWANLTPLSASHNKGSRSFATTKELSNEYRSVPEKKELYEGKGGFPISRNGDRIYIDDSPVNNLIIGTTRSGKSEICVVPAIDIYSRPQKISDRASMIIADPKGELVCASKETLEKRGYEVLVFDLLSFAGLSYNPLQLVLEAYISGNVAEAQLLANTLSYVLFHDPNSKDKTWENWSIALTNALILAITIDCCKAADGCADPTEKTKWYSKVNMYSVSRLLIDLGELKEDDKSQLDKFFSSRDLNDIARIQYASVAYASGKTKGNIFANTLAQLIKFTMDRVAKMTSGNTVSLKDIGFSEDHPTAVFLVIPDYDTSNQFLVTMFISQLYYVLSRESTVAGGKCLREVIFLLDEFGNITPIPQMAHILTVCLGRNIRFDLIVQSYSQIFNLYGEHDGRTILGACGNQIYLLTIEEDTARKMSALIGNKTITSFSRSETNSLSLDKTMGEHIDTQPLLNPNELMEFKPGESVVVRITKRTDLHGNKIHPNPIFNHGRTEMKYRYEYLADDFSNDVPYEKLSFRDACQHRGTDLESVTFHVPTFATANAILAKPIPFAVSESLTDLLTSQQKECMLSFFSAAGFDASTIDLAVTLTEFDRFLQDLFDKSAISQTNYDDIYTVLSNIRFSTPGKEKNTLELQEA